MEQQAAIAAMAAIINAGTYFGASYPEKNVAEDALAYAKVLTEHYYAQRG